MKQFFYSLKAGYILFILLAVIFGMGNHLTGIPEYNSIFKDMTATHLMYCLKAILAKPVMVIWLLAFIFIGICLFINTWCCTTTQIRLFFQTRRLERSKLGRVGQMALIHIVALMVIALHALDITLIQRHKPVKFYSDQIAWMGDYQVRVKQISYVHLNSMITEDKTGSKRKGLHNLEKDFSTKQNFARIEIIKDQEKPAVRDLRMLSPIRIGATFFFLDEFFIARDSQRIGVKIHHSYNPLAFVFFAVYMVLFALLVFRFFTVRVKENGKE
jgi:hypothetical protein